MSLPSTILRIVFLVMLISPVHAEKLTARQALDAFLNKTHTLTASFNQMVLQANNDIPTQRASGVFSIKRPSRFHWLYEKPYQQLLVADGLQIWIYDIDLEQVTVKPQLTTLEDTPAFLLSGSSNIEDRFDIKMRDSDTNGSLDWVDLMPKSENASFARISLAFKDNELNQMEMVDGFDQTTLFQFSDIRTNVALEPNLFKFVPPANVEILDDFPEPDD